MDEDEDEDWSSFHSMGGLARAAKLSPERRSAIATKAAEVRWSDLRAGGHLLKQPPVVRLCVSLHLPGALAGRLVTASRADGMSLSQIVSRAVEAWLTRRASGEKGNGP